MSAEEENEERAEDKDAGHTRRHPDKPPSEANDNGLDGLTENLGLDPVSPDHDPLIGKDIGGVTLVRVIAEGGMGRVYEGVQDKPRRPVAVKVMRPGLASKEICRRFDNESEVLGRLRHPFIAQIYSAGVCTIVGAQVPYFVMEYITDALPISQYATRHKLTTEQRIELFRKVCEAVAHGHEKGVVHRDLKPSNILVEPSGLPKVIDFGVARSVDASAEQMTALTDIGQLIGTVQYMSPEQFTADPSQIDMRADVYALGVILYELLTGKPPYEIRRKQIFEAAEVVRKQKPVAPSKLNSTIRPDVEKITGTCLQKNRDRRYANAAELAHALGSYLGGQPVASTSSGIGSRLQDVWKSVHSWRKVLAAVGTGVVAASLMTVAAFMPSKPQPAQRLVEVQAGMMPEGSELAGTRVSSFAISRFETTWKEWTAVRGFANAHGFDLHGVGAGDGDDFPVRRVSWFDAIKWCNAKSLMDGLKPIYFIDGEVYRSGQRVPRIDETGDGYRLPTDAEWEWAARGGDASKGFRFSGSNDAALVAWFAGNNNPAGPKRVGTKKPNELSLYDMTGNVWEWCWDNAGDGDHADRRFRSMSYDDPASELMVSKRHKTRPDNRGEDIGFRYVRNEPGAAVESTPLRVAINGLGGKQFLDPETFGPNWLGFNPRCSGDEKAWIKDGAFACIASRGALAWPSAPTSRYVCEFEMTFTGQERDLKICFGDPWDATQLFFDYVPDRKAVECTHRIWRHGGWGWCSHRDFQANKRHVFTIVVSDGRQTLLESGRPVLGVDDPWPTDCRLRIWSGTGSGTIIHNLSFRPLTAADAQGCGYDMPPTAIDGRPDVAAGRIKRLTEGLTSLPVAGKRFKAAVVGSPMAWIEPGQFEMGSRRADDAGRRAVRITKGFWIGQAEVTQREYRQVMGDNPSRIGGSEYLPVDWVSWEECQEFCHRLNEAARKAGSLPTGYEYRLPTEAEWEYCGRAGSDADFSVPRSAIWDRDRSGRRPHEVAESEPNAWGLYDMHGNAMEWCLDRWYDSAGRTTVLETDPYHPGKPARESFVVRGGAWWSGIDGCSSHWRSMCTNTPAGGYRGFRIVLGPRPGVVLDKTLVAWTTLATVDQRGGGVLSLENGQTEFDAIVFGEAVPFRWTTGCDWGRRACPTPERVVMEEAKPTELVQIAIVYSGSSIALYRNGMESVRYEKDTPVPFRVADAIVLLGTRLVPVPGNGLFSGEIDDARIYDVALTAEQIHSLVPNELSDPKPLAWWHFEDGTIADSMGTFSETQTFGEAQVRGGRLVLDGKKEFVLCRAASPPVPDDVLEKQLVVDFLDPTLEPGKQGVPEKGRPLDLLALADPTRDAVSGTWKRVGNELESGGERDARIRFPVRSPREYEYTVEFTRLSGEECVGQCCSGEGHGFFWMLGGGRNTIAGLERLDWRDVADNSSAQRRQGWITNGKRHVSKVRVEMSHVTAFFDGEEILSMPIDWSRVSYHPSWTIPDDMLGLGTWHSPTRFHKATVIDVGRASLDDVDALPSPTR